MSFGTTPVTGFPPAAPEEFPMGLQWQLSGVDVGTRAVDTVNFVAGSALAMEVDPDDPKKLTITIPGAGGSAVPTLVLSLEGNSAGSFSGSEFTNWAADVLVESADAAWNESQIVFASPGFYRLSIAGRVSTGTGAWLGDVGSGSAITKYGSDMSLGVSVPPGLIQRTVHERTAFDGGSQETDPDYVAWFDEYVIQVSDAGDYAIPALYARHYSTFDDAYFWAVVTVTKVG
jgi:hypothetical protein